MKIIEGDLIQLGAGGAFDIIVHGCNCFHRMGAGIAKFIAREFPHTRNGHPLICAGLAGGDWSEISQRINNTLAQHDNALDVLPGTKF